MSGEPPNCHRPKPTPGAKLRARILLVGLGLLVAAYVAVFLIRP